MCDLILDCWWEEFDVRAFLVENAPEELETLQDRKPVSRVASIVDIARKAREREKPRD